jgi:2-polyprenyl-6-methoxyphenol hydroxylase-like FAD-dependent oxidoreductase
MEYALLPKALRLLRKGNRCSRVEFREVRSAAGREWTDDGQVHEVRKPKGGPKNSVRQVPIPPELVRMLREHVETYGTADERWHKQMEDFLD